jgi:hypothetical protein
LRVMGVRRSSCQGARRILLMTSKSYVFMHEEVRLATMKFQCIKCQVTWGEGDPEAEGYSHGLCLTCLRETLLPTVRRRQLREGYFDCFGRATCYCDQQQCKYRQVCLCQAAE